MSSVGFFGGFAFFRFAHFSFFFSFFSGFFSFFNSFRSEEGGKTFISISSGEVITDFTSGFSTSSD